MEIASKLTETVYVASRTSLDANGDPTYGDPRPVACRVERTKGVTDNGPSGTRTSISFTLVTVEQLLPTDMVWLPGSDTSDASAARMPGPGGVQPAVRLRGSATLFYETVL